MNQADKASLTAIEAEIAERQQRERAKRPLKERLLQMVRAVDADPPHIGVLSTGERCAVALIMNRPELLARGDTMLYAAHRVGHDWLECCWEVQRDGWI